MAKIFFIDQAGASPELDDHTLPGASRKWHKSRHRHGRQSRGVMLMPHLPAWRTRRQIFDELVIQSVRTLSDQGVEVGTIEYAVEEVPPSDPPSWELPGAILGRTFLAERRAGLRARVVIYRLPISRRCKNLEELRQVVFMVVVDNTANALGCLPSDLDPQA